LTGAFSDFSGVMMLIPILVGGVVYSAALLLVRGITTDEIAFARRALALAR
jgi:hypothetical protein